jgi:hypothetical protein
MIGINTGSVLQLDQLDSDEGRWFVAWHYCPVEDFGVPRNS